MDGFNSDYMNQEISKVTRENGLGSFNSRAAEALWGINYRANGVYLPVSTDQHGLTLFTKFDMNLQNGNITQDNHLTNLLTPDPLTYQRAVRAYLDPYGAIESGYGTPLVDNKNPFIPVLTNALLSVSGFPDNTLSSYVSPEGIMGEVWSVVDGVYRIRGSYNITTTFNNIEGGIIAKIFDTIGIYCENIMANKMKPYPWNEGGITMDNTTRIWRLILDPSRRFVRHIGYTGYCFPRVNPQGALFNFDSEQNFITDNQKISIEWQCVGAVYNDPYSFSVFNYLVEMFNPDLRIKNVANLHREGIRVVGEDRYYRVTPDNLEILTGYCYPLIHPNTQELTWFIEKSVFNRITGYNPNNNQLKESLPDNWVPPTV